MIEGYRVGTSISGWSITVSGSTLQWREELVLIQGSSLWKVNLDLLMAHLAMEQMQSCTACRVVPANRELVRMQSLRPYQLC